MSAAYLMLCADRVAGDSSDGLQNCNTAPPMSDLLQQKKVKPDWFVTEMATSASGQPQWRVVLVLGPPGSGKGTQCSRLVNLHQFAHFSAGEQMRIERDSGSELGTKICKADAKGDLLTGQRESLTPG